MIKTTKSKTVSKPKKTSGAGKNVPSEEEIREKAREIYYERISRGEKGTPEGDWKEAEELLRGL
jgi:RAB protein geranylgeranyltransferase component A